MARFTPQDSMSFPYSLPHNAFNNSLSVVPKTIAWIISGIANVKNQNIPEDAITPSDTTGDEGAAVDLLEEVIFCVVVVA